MGTPLIPVQERFDSNYIPEPNSGCWLWTGALMSKGYGQFWVRGSNVRAHRLSYELHKGKIPDGLNVLHHCDVRCCVNPEHLFCGTLQDNADDMKAKGRQSRLQGEAHGMAKLTTKDIDAIFRLRADGLLHREIADQFDIHKGTVADILAGKRWGHYDGYAS